MNQQHMHKFEIVFYSPDRSWVSAMDGLIPENRYIATNDHMGHRFVTVFCEKSEADLVRMSVEKFIDRLSQMINQDVTVFESIGWGQVYGKMTVSSGIDPQDPMGAIIILDHAMGDEWMNVDPDWAMDQIDIAIQTLEQHGLMSSLPGRYSRFVNKWIEEN